MQPPVCDGLRVLEFGSGMPVALAGMILADNGAEVIKVEPPAGDPARGIPAWYMWGRGKKSVVLDLRDDGDRARAQSLIATADVLIENFRPGIAEQFGIAYEQHRSSNPRLIHCRITGFGNAGPRARVKAYEGVVAAVTGQMQQYASLTPERRPAYLPVPLASYGAAQSAIQGICAALLMREKNGRGQLVETSLAQGIMPFNLVEWLTWQLAQKYPDAFIQDPSGGGDRLPLFSSASGNGYTKDNRWLNFINLAPRQFTAFRHATGLDGIWKDIGGTDSAVEIEAEEDEGRYRFQDAFLRRIQEKSLDEWVEIFIADSDIAFEEIREPIAALDHPQMLHNGHVVEVMDPVVGKTRQLGPLVTMAETRAVVGAPAPELGQYQQEIMAPLGSFAGEGPAASARQAVSVAHPLEGVTVVETAQFFAGPYSSALLADLGARVVKVEPLTGDPLRPLYSLPEVGGVNTTQGKECIAVDLKTEEGREILRKLVVKADVFFHNYRPGVCERMGLSYEALRKVNPRLVFLHATGYGMNGPLAGRPIYATTASTVSGNSLRQAAGRVPPPGSQLDIAEIKEASLVLRGATKGEGDPTAALGAATAMMLGLVALSRTGKGQEVVTSMICSNAYANSDECIDYRGRPPVALADESLRGIDALYRIYDAQDGYVFLAAPQEKEWVPLCKALGHSEWLEDARLITPEARQAHDAELISMLEQIFREKPADVWEAELTQQDIACVKVYTGLVSELECTDPAYRESGFVVEVEHPLFGKHLRHGATVHLSDAPPRLSPGCLIGQHTLAILQELGYTVEEAETLKERAVVTW